MSSTPTRSIYTIGHSNHSLDTFLDILKAHEIEVLVDIRSQPYAKYATYFSGRDLKAAVIEAGIRYLFLGKELGGRPQGDEYYDPEGYVLYGRVAESALFQEGIARLEKGLEKHRVAMMCSEENPAHCHRHLLVGRVLAERGITVNHIYGDGRVRTGAGLVQDETERAGGKDQLALFETQDVRPWKSIRSVSPRSRRPTSSAP
jgi:uncharacterized protein (DUF488 family)